MRAMAARVFLIVAFLAAAAPRPDTRIDDLVRAEMARQKVPGVAIGIVSKGSVIKAQGYGLANVEHGVPVTPETIFQSGSLGKQFTSAGVMLQVEAGKIALSDPITKYLPDAPDSWRAITVRHLLTHTSGIPDYTTGTFDYRKDYTEDQLAKFAYAMKPEFPPGSRWNYSNTGYVLLGIILHKATGKFYGDVLAESLFKPLGMTTTRVITERDIVPHRAAGYQLIRGELKNQDWVAPMLNTTADGSLYFSVKDLLAWDAGVRGRKVLKEESWKQILDPVKLTSGKPYPYGFGWGIEERAGKPLHRHGGSWQGFETYYARFVGDDLSIIVLTNLAQGDPGVITDKLAALINPTLAVPEPTPIEDREPKVTAGILRLLDDVRDGKLSPERFAYVRAGFFPDAPRRYAEELKSAGAIQKAI